MVDYLIERISTTHRTDLSQVDLFLEVRPLVSFSALVTFRFLVLHSQLRGLCALYGNLAKDRTSA
jgi:hypothetical protein